MSEETQPQSYEFRAEVRQLLNILVHSLYSDREIFLRELISNASDAINRIQFEMLTNHDVLDPDLEPQVQIDFDEEAKTISISDTGVGMTKEELIRNLGTLAQSGVAEFLEKVESGEELKPDVIGQFGVGFYSVFMIANEVRVTSRSYLKDEEAHVWISQGADTFEVEPAQREQRGTTVELMLKEDAAELASQWKLEQIIKKHSDFTSFPIKIKDKQVNQQTALWRQSPREVSDEQYGDFYKSLTLEMEAPLAHVHVSVDAPVHIQAILYVSSSRERGILSLRKEDGLKLYSRRVLIKEYSKDFLPNHFRFVTGVVDSEDLPLNVSRETIQNDRMVQRISKVLTNRLTDELGRLAKEDSDSYDKFWEQFGQHIKEGVSMDPAAQSKLTKLLRFPSSKSEEGKLTALADYVERMQDDQEAIFYIIGADNRSVAHSPHLDYFRKHDIEVLYWTDPLDGFLATTLHEFDGKSLQNVDDAGLDLPEEGGEESSKEEVIEKEQFDALLERFRTVLGDRVVEVKESRTLSDSPVRLVSPKDATADRDMARVRRLLNQDYEVPKKIMEVNPAHLLTRNLAQKIKAKSDDPIIEASIEQLYDSALLIEGLHPNPAEMVDRIQQLLEAATKM